MPVKPIINFDDFEKRNLENQARNSRRIRAIYNNSIQQITLTASRIKHPDGRVFEIAKYPSLQKKVDTVINSMQKEIYTVVVSGIKEGWQISNDKNNLIVDRRLGKIKPPEGIKKLLYDPNKQGLESFLQRKDKGLGLSDRVWKSLDPFKTELEQGLGLGIADGKGAGAMAKELKQYLNEPEKLFRRVRDAKGKLQLSKAAEEYKPGQGVYRSSYKNALRLSRSENNMAYRIADHERWKSMPFVTGIDVKLSGSHPRYDICDSLVGAYPKDFKFVGWHPQCLCFAVPKFVSDADYDKIEDAILDGTDPDLSKMGQVTKPPAGFTDYFKNNRERINGWASKPYWIKDNPQYISSQPVKRKPPEPKPAPKPSPPPAPAPPPQPKLVPGGNPIGRQFTTFDSAIKKEVMETLSEIDKIHGDGILKDIPFEKTTGKARQGAIHFTGVTPSKISLSTNARNKTLTVAHEMGHYLDNYSIGTPLKFSSLDPSTPTGKVVEVIKKSALYKKLLEIRSARKLILGDQTFPLDSRLVSHVKYLMDPKELWARAYGQFIVKRSGNKTANADLVKYRDLDKEKSFPQQWDEDDFKDIEKAIEKMMIDLGWIVNQ